jgi:transcriptional regulator with XRE-family HTH domain
MKKNPRLEARRKNIGKDVDIFVDKSFELANRIHFLLMKNGKEQKDLAKALGKSESEISKWMTGTHNFTIRTIACIESVLNEDVFIVAGKEKARNESKIIYISTNATQIPSRKNNDTVNTSGNFKVQEGTFDKKFTVLA